MRRTKRVIFGTLILVVVGLFLWIYPLARDVIKSGLLDQQAMRKYNGDSAANLKAMYTAMMLYHDSEGQFPASSGWMDAIQNRIKTADLTGDDANKKLVHPMFRGQMGKFGYAMNDAASGKYKDDIKDKKMPLLFDSTDTSRNAHGDPTKLLPKPPRHGGNLAIAIDGTLLHP